MAAIATTKSPDVTEDIENAYHRYFWEVPYHIQKISATTFHPKLLKVQLGHHTFGGKFNYRGYLEMPEYEDELIPVPNEDLLQIASRIGHLDLMSIDIHLFLHGATTANQWRHFFNSMINLDTIRITCCPSEVDDFKCLVDIFLRSADLPNLRVLEIYAGVIGGTSGPIPIDGEALLNFLAYHPTIEELTLGNVVPMDEYGAGGIARNVTNLIMELRKRRDDLMFGMGTGPYIGDYWGGGACEKPEAGSGEVNKCFCRSCVSGALSRLGEDLGVSQYSGYWRFGELIARDAMPGPCEDEEMEIE